MSALCPTCREPVRELMRVYNLTIESGECMICLQPASDICVFVPCGHPVCAGCSRQWVARLHNPIRVPGGPAAAVSREDFVRDDMSAASAESYSSDEEESVVGPPDIPWLAPMPFASTPPPLLEPVPLPVPLAPLPPPWLAPEPFAPTPAWAPLYEEVFQYRGRSVMWTQIWRFWNEIVLVDSDTGRPSRDGHQLAFPPAIRGFHVTWHMASNSSNNKWLLCADVHDV